MKNKKIAPKLFGAVFALAALVFFAHSASAAIYYVDSSAGNDSNNGTSQSTPWKTTDKVNSDSFSPGDSILFKKGGVWRGQLVPKSSGTSASPIIYGAYGTGNAPLIIDGKFFAAGTSWSGSGINGEYTLDVGDSLEFGSEMIGVLRGQPTGVDTYKRVEQGEAGSLGEDQVGISTSSGRKIIYFKPPIGHNPKEYDWDFSKWDGGPVLLNSNISWIVVDGFTLL